MCEREASRRLRNQVMIHTASGAVSIIVPLGTKLTKRYELARFVNFGDTTTQDCAKQCHVVASRYSLLPA